MEMSLVKDIGKERTDVLPKRHNPQILKYLLPLNFMLLLAHYLLLKMEVGVYAKIFQSGGSDINMGHVGLII